MVDGVINIPLRGRPLVETTSADTEGGERAALDHFVAGPENRLAEVAVRGVLHGDSPSYNPVVIYGPAGTGKSHLAWGIAEFRSRQLADQSATDRRVVCVSARTFARELANAFEVHSVEEFRQKYRECDLLVLEDVGQLAGKAAAQEELVHTIDELIANDAQLVVTSAEHPTQLVRISPALRSRLIGGLTAQLSPPSRAVRAIVLRRLARLRRIELHTAAAAMLTKEISGTVPRLIDALLEMEKPARLDGGVIDCDLAQAYLDNHAARRGPQIRQIAIQTARYFSLRLADLRGPSRQRNIVTARSVAMYLARTLNGANYQLIGQEFGGRDHTTVMHSYRKIKRMVKSDPAIQKAVEHLLERFAEGVQPPNTKGSALRRTSA